MPSGQDGCQLRSDLGDSGVAVSRRQVEGRSVVEERRADRDDVGAARVAVFLKVEIESSPACRSNTAGTARPVGTSSLSPLATR